MADIFVSYAKVDRPLASKFVAMLEAEGWKVWWDTSLVIGDDFRNEIMTELGRARTVIVIWTDTSIKSDWVRSEAGRAQADRKLIPVKLPHLNYKDLPPPFDVLHTEDIGQEDKIKAAVLAQLAKPAVEPSAIALLTKGLRYELLTWWGIIGGAVALFVAISTTLKLADWARFLVEHWKQWTHAFWVWVFGWLGIHVPAEWTPVLSFLLFWSLLVIGQAFKFRSTVKHRSIVDKDQGKSFQLISWRLWVSIVVMPIFIYVCILLAVGSFDYLGKIFSIFMPILKLGGPAFTAMFGFDLTLGGIAFAPVIVIMIFAKHRLYAAIVTFLMLIFWTIITGIQLTASDYWGDSANGIGLTFIISWVLPLILLTVAPVKAASRQLIFLALGLLLLIAINELSKLGLDVTAPKL
jgi:TIR domain